MPRPRSAELAAVAAGPRVRPDRRIGIIDVGSNTARCVAFEASTSGAVRAFYEVKDSPRLGLGTGTGGRLSADAIARGIRAVDRFARTVRSLDLPRTVAVATSAVRDAPNGPEFVRQVARATGVALRVLSGTEEAQYAYLGVAGAWPLGDDLVSDLGGGSLQLAEVRAGRLRHSVSLPLGVLRLSQRFFEHDPPKRREVDAVRSRVRVALRSALAGFGPKSGRLFGVGGTVRALARAAIELQEYPVERVHGYPLWDRDLTALGELLGEMPSAKRRAVPGIGADRADVVGVGIVVLQELVRATGTGRIVVAGTGIREGLALEAIGAALPASAEELADRSVAAAAESFGVPGDHGREMTRTALGLFRALASRGAWGSSEGLALRVAGGMHDAGVAIDLWHHAHHSAYLIQNYPIRGLDPREILLASMAARTHAGGDLPSAWKKGFLPILRPADVATARQLGTLLEVAELAAAARPRFSLRGGGRTLTVAFSPPVDTPLPAHWEEKVRKPMEREFGVEVRFRAV